ncbi:unnamed protein product, partial [Rotaria sp. Silwood1]
TIIPDHDRSLQQQEEQEENYSRSSIIDKSSSTNILAVSNINDHANDNHLLCSSYSDLSRTRTILPNSFISSSSTCPIFNRSISSIRCTTENQSTIPLKYLLFPVDDINNQLTTLNNTNVEEKENFHLSNHVENWSIVQVEEYIEKLTNNTNAEVFREHDIDGRALLLLTGRHLCHKMKIKLDKALVILNGIRKLRQYYGQSFS